MIKRLPFYFAAEGSAGSDLSAGKDQASNTTAEQGNGAKNDSESVVTYTQKQLQELLAKEKRQGKNSVLNALGLKTVDEAKAALTAAKAAADATKTEEQLAADALNAANSAKKAAEDDLLAAKRTIAVMRAGFKPEFVDDVVAIAAKKVTDEKDFEAVISEMKTTHSFYLVSESKTNEGTGSAASGYKKNSEAGEESYGAKLAKKNVETIKKNNEYSFFK